MNAIKLLENQHREVEALFKKLESGEKMAGGDRKSLFHSIQQRLELHTHLEEKLFYPDSEEVDEKLTLEAYEEHALVKTMLKKLENTDPSEGEFMAQVKVLRELVEHHVKEEEKQLFPECKKQFGDEKLQAIGEQMLAEQEKVATRLAGKSAA